MLEEIVHTILPNIRTLFCKNKPNANRANNRKRRSETNRNKNEIHRELNLSVDNAKTHALKIPNFKVPLLVSFLIFYVCVINVIISCDVSVSDVNSKELKGLYEREIVREKPKHWRGHKYYDNYVKDLQGRVSMKRQTQIVDEKLDAIDSEGEESIKYYDYRENRDVNETNVTEYPQFHKMPKYMNNDSLAIGHPHDLTSNPYFVKNVQLNLRPERHLFKHKIVKLGVLLPADPDHQFSLAKVLPILELAIPAITSPDGPLPGWTIWVDYRDTKCSSIVGPLAAFEFYVHDAADAFIGPGCEYVIAPVARYAGQWGIPVLTAGAQAEAFAYKSSGYTTLTRMMGSYTQAGVAIRKVFEEFKWIRVGMLFHNNPVSAGKGNSPCFLTLSAVFTVLNKKNKGDVSTIDFDENHTSPTKLKELLKKLSLNTRSK